MNQLFTIGHSNQSQEEFLAMLRRYGIDCVVDVRSDVTGDDPLSQAWRMELLLINVYFPTSSALFSERFCNFVANKYKTI